MFLTLKQTMNWIESETLNENWVSSIDKCNYCRAIKVVSRLELSQRFWFNRFFGRGEMSQIFIKLHQFVSDKLIHARITTELTIQLLSTTRELKTIFRLQTAVSAREFEQSDINSSSKTFHLKFKQNIYRSLIACHFTVIFVIEGFAGELRQTCWW